MLILIGASASGKTEVAKRLIASYGFKKMVTTTTRAKRINEINGIDYHFITQEQFLEAQSKNEFFETAQYSGFYYGTPKDGINANTVLIVEPSGANTIYHAIPNDVVIVYINTPEIIRKARMIQRGDHIDIIEQRLLHDATIFTEKNLDHIDFIIENNNIDLDTLSQQINQFYQKKYPLKQNNVG